MSSTTSGVHPVKPAEARRDELLRAIPNVLMRSVPLSGRGGDPSATAASIPGSSVRCARGGETQPSSAPRYESCVEQLHAEPGFQLADV